MSHQVQKPKSCHEDAQCHLVSDVTDEVPHHPRSELLRSECERQNGDREDHAHGSDDGRSDCNQNLATCVGAPGSHPPGQILVVAVCRQVDYVGHCEHNASDGD
jgi:hypothetical protein